MYYFKLFITNALVVLVCTFAKAQNQTDMQEVQFSLEQKEVLNAVEKMTNAFHMKDIKGVMESYESASVVVFEPQSPISDPQVLRQMFQGAFTLNPKFTYSGHEVFINGDIAIHIAPWKMAGAAPDGTQVKQSGLSIAILRKQENGEWLMIFDNPHGNFLMNQK